MADIRFNINSKNIDLKKVWEYMKYNQNSELNQ